MFDQHAAHHQSARWREPIHEHRSQPGQRRRVDVGNHDVEQSLELIDLLVDDPHDPVDVVVGRVAPGDVSGSRIEVDRHDLCRPEQRRRDRQHARPRANVQHHVPSLDDDLEQLEDEARRCVRAGPEAPAWIDPYHHVVVRYTDRLAELAAAPSVGSKGDAYDNAMAEAWVATFKSELVDGRRFPSFEHAEHEILHWIGFYNAERLHEALGDVPPAEYEQLNIKRDNSPLVATT